MTRGECVTMGRMISTKHIIVFTAWLACLGGAYSASLALTPDYSKIPVFLTWSSFVFGAIVILGFAILSDSRNRKMWIGSAVFSISSIVVFFFADLNGQRTPGVMIAEMALFTDAPNIPPFSTTVGGPRLNSDPIVAHDLWIVKLNNFVALFDLAVASCMTFFGAYLGAFHQRNRE